MKLRGDLVLACVVGETQGGEGTHFLMESGFRTDAAVLTEPFGIGNLVTVHGGIVHFAVHTYGVTGHVSRIEETVNAVGQMTRVIEALRNVEFTYTPRADLPALPRLNVGSIIGGRGEGYVLTEPPYVPDLCTIIVDVHFVPGQSAESVVADVRRTLDPLKDGDPGFDYAIEIPPPACFKGCRRLVMDPLDVPADAAIVQAVARNHEKVTGSPAQAHRRPSAHVLLRRRQLLALETRHPLPPLRSRRRLPGPRPGRQLHLHQRDGDVRRGAGEHGHGRVRRGMSASFDFAPLSPRYAPDERRANEY